MQALRAAVIGCGIIGRHQARVIRGAASLPIALGPVPDMDLCAACDSDIERLSAFQAEFGMSIVSTDYRALLTRDDIDAVLVCVPPSMHRDITVAAAESRKHIFCQKPMAMSSAECFQMIEAARAAEVILQIGYVLRFSTERGRLRDAVRNGELGRPVLWRETTVLSAGADTVWTHDRNLGGGVLWENSHPLDFWISTFGDPISVYAFADRYKPDDTANAPDSIAALITFSSGDHVVFSDSWALPGFGWDNMIHKASLQIEVIGPQGVAFYPDEDWSQVLTIQRNVGKDGHRERMPWTSDWGAGIRAYWEELHHFSLSVREGRASPVSGEDGCRVIWLIEGILQSAQTGRVCHFEDGRPISS